MGRILKIKLFSFFKCTATIALLLTAPFVSFSQVEKDSLKMRRNVIFIEAGQILNPEYSISKESLIPYTNPGFKLTSKFVFSNQNLFSRPKKRPTNQFRIGR